MADNDLFSTALYPDDEDFVTEGGNAPEYSVSDLSTALRQTIEGAFGRVRVRGEISGFRGRHGSGHAYFALKDDKSKLDAVVWRGVYDKLKVKPEEGMEVIAEGKLTTYAGRSSYQLIIDRLSPAGIGALMALLEERRKKLEAEGLFDESRKQSLPFLPRRLGLITSPTGAVIRDMANRLDDRFPLPVLLWPVRVQGDGAAEEIARAIDGFNAMSEDKRPDLIIVARGGGSIEDLWCFNEEIVLRAVARSTIALISAVGHETDWTLLDYVADMRAPTPTAAIELGVPVRRALIEQLETLRSRLGSRIGRDLESRKRTLSLQSRQLGRPHDYLGRLNQSFDFLLSRFYQSQTKSLLLKKNRLQALRLGFHLLSGLRQNAQTRHNDLARRLNQAPQNFLLAKSQSLLFLSGLLSPARLHRRLSEQSNDLKRLSRTFNPDFMLYKLRKTGLESEQLSRQLAQAMGRHLSGRQKQLESRGALLQALSYENVLMRGFAVLKDSEGRALTTPDELDKAAHFTVKLHHGERQARLINAPRALRKENPGSGSDDQSRQPKLL